MRLGLVQTKQNELYDFANSQLYFEKYQIVKLQKEMTEQTITRIKKAAQAGCDMIVTTEAINFCGTPDAVACQYPEVIPTEEDVLFLELSKIAKESNAYLFTGVYNQRENKCYNSVFVYDKLGKRIAVYDKIHLAGSENEQLTSGEDYLVIPTEYGTIGVLICWDMQFPEAIRELVLRDADLIVCPTWGWEQIYAHARAYENGIYVAGAMGVPFQGTISGIRNPSEVISPVGEVLASASRTKADVLICDFDMRDCKAYKELRLSNRHPNTYKTIGALV